MFLGPPVGLPTIAQVDDDTAGSTDGAGDMLFGMIGTLLIVILVDFVRSGIGTA